MLKAYSREIQSIDRENMDINDANSNENKRLLESINNFKDLGKVSKTS